MTWRALVTDHRRSAIETIVREIVDAVDAAASTVAGDPVARALLRAYAAEGDVVPDRDGAGDAALEGAVASIAATRAGPELFGGLAGIGWLVAHLAGGETADEACENIDAALLAGIADWSGNYDLIGGLVGFGVYALERGEPGRPLAVRVLDHLSRLARPRAGGLAWHTALGLLPPLHRGLAPDGYWNLGLAHGAAGVVALLARFVASGIEVGRARELLDRAVASLLATEPARLDGRYPAWHAGGSDDTLAPGREAGDRRTRLAWCYGDLGISMALWSAARATGDDGWRSEALALARACADRSQEQAEVLDASVCHGAIGAAHLFNRLHHATGEALFARATERWLARALDMRTGLAGLPSRRHDDGVERPDGSLLDGATGIGLVLHSMITDVEPSWDRLLLVDIDGPEA